MHQSSLSPLLTVVSCLVCVGVIGFLGTLYLDNQTTAIKNEAVSSCMTAAQSTWNTVIKEDETKTVNNSVVEPNAQWYQTCLAQKGIVLVK